MRLLYMLCTNLDYIIKLTIYDISVGLEKKIKNYTKVLNLPVNVKKKFSKNGQFGVLIIKMIYYTAFSLCDASSQTW